MKRTKHTFIHKSGLLVAALLMGMAATVWANDDKKGLDDSDKHFCLVDALDIGDGNKLGLCNRHAIDDLSDAGKITAIIYDTSDQILLPAPQRSQAWLNAAANLGLRQRGIKESWLKKRSPVTPTMLDTFWNVTPLGKHFYHASVM